MAKNNCCRICGRLDYDDDGEYLVCRACGEKRKKKRIPHFEALMTSLSFTVFIVFTIFVFSYNYYRHEYLTHGFDKYVNYYYDFDFLDWFLNATKDHIVWFGPLLWFLDLCILTVAIYFAWKVYKALINPTII